MELWAGQFGKEYTDRNPLSLKELESVYVKELYSITLTEMNARFIGDLNRDMKVLEIGAGMEIQLLCLQEAGFKNLYGIELQSYAVELSKGKTKGINLIQGSVFDIPFRDGFFDLVFTSGLLIHIGPEDISDVMDEIYRCTKQYIWCLESYADSYTTVNYRKHDNLYWKANFSKLFLERFPHLTLVKEEHFTWRDKPDNIDAMFLLEKM